ncbi:MAG: hypothetical protein ACYC96_01695 [Fimbriimonadaceae bacterium]
MPTVDVPPETASSLLLAAELYGHYDASAVLAGNVATAALQLAVWQTLYPAYGPLTEGTGLTFDGSGNGPALQTAVTNYTSNATLSGLSSADLNGVVWYDYTSGSGNGQGQFGRPGATPEPFTLVLGAAGLVFAARRRMLARKA